MSNRISKKSFIEKHKITPLICNSCKRNIWIVLDRRYYCRRCAINKSKPKHQIDSIT